MKFHHFLLFGRTCCSLPAIAKHHQQPCVTTLVIWNGIAIEYDCVTTDCMTVWYYCRWIIKQSVSGTCHLKRSSSPALPPQLISYLISTRIRLEKQGTVPSPCVCVCSICVCQKAFSSLLSTSTAHTQSEASLIDFCSPYGPSSICWPATQGSLCLFPVLWDTLWVCTELREEPVGVQNRFSCCEWMFCVTVKSKWR